MNRIEDGSAAEWRAVPGARLALLWCATAAAIAAAAAYRLPQPPEYHAFADTRTLFGIPNFTNVASNLGFALAGIAGLTALSGRRQGPAARFLDRRERALYGVFFSGNVALAFGSGLYHYSPSNATLFWDRLPMVVCVAAFVGAIFAERFGARAGVRVFAALAVVLPGTALYWLLSESLGSGNVWPYICGMYGALFVGGLAVALIRSRYTLGAQEGVVLLIFSGAMLFDTLLDRPLLAFIRVMGGHALKHIVAAFAAFWLWWFMLRKRAIRRDPHPPAAPEPTRPPRIRES